MRGPDDDRAAALERYLHDHIPLSRSMGVEVREARPDRVVLRAPLDPNVNHRGTFFGGSAAAVCTLAAWGLAHRRIREESGLDVELVVQRSRMEYLEPAHEVVEVVCEAPSPEAWRRFVGTIRRRGKGRVRLYSTLLAGGREVGRFEGSFVALVEEEAG